MKTIEDLEKVLSLAKVAKTDMLLSYKDGDRSEDLIVSYNKLACAIDDSVIKIAEALKYCFVSCPDDVSTILDLSRR